MYMYVYIISHICSVVDFELFFKEFFCHLSLYYLVNKPWILHETRKTHCSGISFYYWISFLVYEPVALHSYCDTCLTAIRSLKMERLILWRSTLHGKCWPPMQTCWRSRSHSRSTTSQTTVRCPWTGCPPPFVCRSTSCTPSQTISQLPSTRASLTSSSSTTEIRSSPLLLATG